MLRLLKKEDGRFAQQGMLPAEQAVRGGVCAEQPCLPAAVCKTAILALFSADKPQRA